MAGASHGGSEAAGPVAPAVAFLLDGRGGARALDPAQLAAWRPEQGALWLQLDPGSPEAKRWIAEEPDLSPGDREALALEPARTRIEVVEGERVIVTARVYRADLEQMASFRAALWPRRLVTLVDGSWPAVPECGALLEHGQGPRDIPELVLELLARGGVQLERVALNLDKAVADLEYEAEGQSRAALATMRALRLEAAAQRRGAARRRETLAGLLQLGPAWLLAPLRDRWRELASRADHLVEVLDGTLERTGAIRDYLEGQMAATLNTRLYVLTVISAILLPLSFITSLLGVNVAGIPGRDWTPGFWLLTAGLVLLALVQFLIARRLLWLPGRMPRSRVGVRAPGERSARPRG